MLQHKIIVIFLLFAIFGNVYTQRRWKSDRKPQVFGEKIPSSALVPRTTKVIKKIVLYHNFFRTKVEPKASNMLAMKWHNDAATAAQRWSDRCHVLVHDPEEGRYTEEYGVCGQNIFVSSHQVPWFFAIKTWFLEHQNFTFGSSSNTLKDVGHYTQMVWATTHEVGCGFTRCQHQGGKNWGKPFFNYVCNYCPVGNWEKKLGRPYKRGEPCSRCPNSCRLGKLCTNSCPHADQWSNCKALMRQAGRGWLCGTDTPQGDQRQQQHCKATCGCTNKIHEWR